MLKGGRWTKDIFKTGSEEFPLVSIITVTFNAEKHLEQALDSILSQTYSNIELIVIDGGSTDQTLQIIRAREDKVDFWQSEPDGGIYDAMNKGLRLARGEWVAFKNADDWFFPDAVEKFVFFQNENPGDVFCGHSQSVIQENPLVAAPFFTDIHSIGRIPGIDHRSCFIRRQAHLQFPFQTKFRLAADLDVFWNLKSNGCRFVQLPFFVSYKRFGGASDGNKILNECFSINRHHKGIWFACKIWVSFQVKFMVWKLGNAILKLVLGKEGFNRFKSRRLNHQD